jgi:hypothetical protein
MRYCSGLNCSRQSRSLLITFAVLISDMGHSFVFPDIGVHIVIKKGALMSFFDNKALRLTNPCLK